MKTLARLHIAAFVIGALPGMGMAGGAITAEALSSRMPLILAEAEGGLIGWLTESVEACDSLERHDGCEFVNPNDELTVDGTCLRMWTQGGLGLACLPLEQTEEYFEPEDFGSELGQS